MADEEKAKAEKLAAAKKRVEALKKKKQAGGSPSATSGKKGAKKEKIKEVDDEPSDKTAVDGDKEDAVEEAKDASKGEPEETVDESEQVVSSAEKSEIKKKSGKKDEKKDKEDKGNKGDIDEAGDEAEATGEKEDAGAADEKDDTSSPPASPKATAPSRSEQSRLRSTSFRHGVPGPSGPLSPSADGETAADIYRKQAMRIDELERQNKRLAKDAADAEKRWQMSEDALADARDGASADAPELAKLVSHSHCEAGSNYGLTFSEIRYCCSYATKRPIAGPLHYPPRLFTLYERWLTTLIRARDAAQVQVADH